MTEGIAFNPEADPSDERLRQLLIELGYVESVIVAIVDRTRGDESARHKWYEYANELKAQKPQT